MNLPVLQNINVKGTDTWWFWQNVEGSNCSLPKPGLIPMHYSVRQ